MKIKIHLRTNKWVYAPAIPTSHPQLFVTPERIMIGKNKSHFSKDRYTVTHKRTGFSITGEFSRDEAIRCAEFLARSDIPWEKIRFLKQVPQYQAKFEKAMQSFYGRSASFVS